LAGSDFFPENVQGVIRAMLNIAVVKALSFSGVMTRLISMALNF
jgi:hypothetical protein